MAYEVLVIHIFLFGKMWKSKTQVMSYKLRVQIYELQVQIHDLLVQLYELRA